MSLSGHLTFAARVLFSVIYFKKLSLRYGNSVLVVILLVVFAEDF